MITPKITTLLYFVVKLASAVSDNKYFFLEKQGSPYTSLRTSKITHGIFLSFSVLGRLTLKLKSRHMTQAFTFVCLDIITIVVIAFN